MRPAGEISQALLTAAAHLVRNEDGQRRGATLQELAHHACVGIHAARVTVKDMRRRGKLEPVAERKVDYRNRPVLEYAPASAIEQEEPAFFDVATVMTCWARG
jgi:hypothetical protein